MLRALAIAVVLAAAVPPSALALDAAAVNAADFAKQPKKKMSGPDPLLVKAEVLLDRARFSPGEIDGQIGENFQKALAAFKAAQGLPDDSKLDAATWEKLTATSSEPAIKDYTITAEDVRGPFIKRLPSFVDMSKLPHMGYLSATQELAERFHMSQELLRALNPGKSFEKPGTVIAVADVARKPTNDKVVRIEIDKTKRTLRGFDKAGNLVVFDPASIGSEERPAPSGTFKVIDVSFNPVYHYDPKLKFKGVNSKKPFDIQPGPNNPVGSVWIGISSPGYGIHGTPDPSRVSKSHSHGCIRLTNWDAEALAALVTKGATVDFLEGNQPAAPVASADEGKDKKKR
jgi:lipoprotein-anchoring transpeptidase ErfK/SrfK